MNRDQLLAELASNLSEMRNELEPLNKRLAEVQAEIDELERPKKEREALGLEISSLRERAAATARELRAAIVKATPTFLNDAVARVKAEGGEAGRRASQDIFLTPARRATLNARAEQCSLAEHQLEKLIFQPGDLTEKVRTILVELAVADLADVPHSVPAEPAVNDDELTVSR